MIKRNTMEVLDKIPVSLDETALQKQLHIDPGSDLADEFRSLMDVALAVGKPKAAYTVSFVEGRKGDTVEIDGVSFRSRMLSRNLASVDRTFPLVATCGREMDEAFPAKGDLLKKYWWDLIKTHLLGAAGQYLNDHLHRTFRLGKTAVMRPGSGDASVWPIEQQRGLFTLLGDVEQAIGVRLMDSFLMIPDKTTSGLLFPTEVDFRSCEVCHRDNCPSRQAPFNQQLWAEIQQD
jgi:hypothetical protein